MITAFRRLIQTPLSESLKKTHGQYTEANSTRCASLIGDFGSTMDSAYGKLIGKYRRRSRPRKPSLKKDVASFVKEFREISIYSTRRAKLTEHSLTSTMSSK